MRIALLRGCPAAIPRNVKKITKKVSAEDDGKVLPFPLPIIPAACIVFFFSPQPPYDTKGPLWRRTQLFIRAAPLIEIVFALENINGRML